MKINVATVFSGIGAIEQACKKVYGNDNVNIVFACDTGERYLTDTKEELDKQMLDMNYDEKQAYLKTKYYKNNKRNYVKDSYFANYKISEKQWYEDIRFLDGKPYKDKVDLLCGGSPCQSFSIIGRRAGLEDARGTLFYDYARLIEEVKPNVFIFENVPGMLSHDNKNTWKVIKEVFESLNYKIYVKVLNSIDFGIPQDRKRLFIVGFKDGNDLFEFPTGSNIGKVSMFDFLEPNVATRHYLGEKGFKFVTNPKYKNRARVNHKIIQTEKANQQFNWNGDFVFEEFDPEKHNEEIMNRAYLGDFDGKRGVIRQLSHRECLRLMGFPDDFKIVVPNVKAYRQAGNSIVVNVLEAILRSIDECEEKYNAKIKVSNSI